MSEDVKKDADEKEQATSQAGDSADDLNTLRTELQQFKQSATTLAAEKQLLEKRIQDRDAEFRREFSRQGQQLGEKVKALEQTLTGIIQPKADAPKKRSRFDENLVVPDPVTDPDNFKRFQAGLIGTLQELQEQNEKLALGGQNTEVEKRLQGKIEALEYKLYLSEQEARLRTEYQFDDGDLARVHDFMKDSNIYDPEAAAIKIPELKRKMFDSQRREDLDARPRQEEPVEPKQKKTPKFDPVKAGQEMLKTASEKVPSGGGKNAEDESLNWRRELKSALENGSFYEWPDAKRKEYQRKIEQAAASGESNGAF